MFFFDTLTGTYTIPSDWKINGTEVFGHSLNLCTGTLDSTDGTDHSYKYVKIPEFNGTLVEIGTFSASGSTVTDITVTCGFQPKYIAVFGGPDLPSSATSVTKGFNINIYNEDISTTYQVNAYRDSNGNYGMRTRKVESSTEMSITGITITGFVYRKPANSIYNGTYYYYAIG